MSARSKRWSAGTFAPVDLSTIAEAGEGEHGVDREDGVIEDGVDREDGEAEAPGSNDRQSVHHIVEAARRVDELNRAWQAEMRREQVQIQKEHAAYLAERNRREEAREVEPPVENVPVAHPQGRHKRRDRGMLALLGPDHSIRSDSVVDADPDNVMVMRVSSGVFRARCVFGF